MKRYLIACIVSSLLSHAALAATPADELTEEEVFDALNEAWSNCKSGCTFGQLPWNLKKHIYKEIKLPNVTKEYSYIVTKKNLGDSHHDSFLIVMSRKDGTIAHGYVSAITPNTHKASKTLVKYDPTKPNTKPQNPNSNNQTNTSKPHSTALVPYIDGNQVVYGTSPATQTSPNPNAGKEIVVYDPHHRQSKAAKTAKDTAAKYDYQPQTHTEPWLTQTANPNEKALTLYKQPNQSGTSPATQTSPNPNAGKEIVVYEPHHRQSKAAKINTKPKPNTSPSPTPTPPTLIDTKHTAPAKTSNHTDVRSKKPLPTKQLPIAHKLNHIDTITSKPHISTFARKKQSARISVYDENSIKSSVNSANTALAE